MQLLCSQYQYSFAGVVKVVGDVLPGGVAARAGPPPGRARPPGQDRRQQGQDPRLLHHPGHRPHMVHSLVLPA